MAGPPWALPSKECGPRLTAAVATISVSKPQKARRDRDGHAEGNGTPRGFESLAAHLQSLPFGMPWDGAQSQHAEHRRDHQLWVQPDAATLHHKPQQTDGQHCEAGRFRRHSTGVTAIGSKGLTSKPTVFTNSTAP